MTPNPTHPCPQNCLWHTDLYSCIQDQALFSHFPSSRLTDGGKNQTDWYWWWIWPSRSSFCYCSSFRGFQLWFKSFYSFFGLFTALELLHGALDQKADTEMQDRQPLLPFFLDWRRSKKHLKRLVLGLFLDIKHIDKRSMLPSSFPLKP